jgi:hypothetical protein
VGVLGGSLTLSSFAQQRSDQSDRSSRDESAQSSQSTRRRTDQASEGQPSSQRQQYSQGQQSGQRFEQRRQSEQGQTYGQRQQIDQRQQYDQGRYDRTDDRSAYTDRSRQSEERSGEFSDRGERQDESSRDSAWLGVYLSERQTHQNGAQVTQVYPAGPAARAGLRAGDVISAVNGQRVSSGSELIQKIEQEEPGARAELTVTRNNQQLELPITLGSRQGFAWSGWGGDRGEQGQYTSSRDSGQAGHSGEEDYWGNVPPFAMQLEHERRMYEQHQRIESQIAKLQDEVRQLRELIQQQRR